MRTAVSVCNYHVDNHSMMFGVSVANSCWVEESRRVLCAAGQTKFRVASSKPIYPKI